MPVQSSEIRLQTRAGYDVHDVTEAVRAAVNTSGLARGTVTVFVTGSTGAVTTVEYEPGLVQDLRELFDRIVPEGPAYHHDRRWHDGNGHAHVRASLVGPSLTVPFDVEGSVGADGLALGTWQQVIFLDFDPPARERRLAVTVIGE
jgi:secondary thiamine-phosphate synthase enzyme